MNRTGTSPSATPQHTASCFVTLLKGVWCELLSHQMVWLTAWLIVGGSAIAAGLHLIFGSPTSVSVCLWDACDVVRWIKWRGEKSDAQSQRLKAQSVCCCFSLYPGEGWTWVGLSASESEPSTQSNNRRQPSICCFNSANTAAGALSGREKTPKYDKSHMLICFKSCSYRCDKHRPFQIFLLKDDTVLIHHFKVDFRALMLQWEEFYVKSAVLYAKSTSGTESAHFSGMKTFSYCCHNHWKTHSLDLSEGSTLRAACCSVHILSTFLPLSFRH